MRIKHENPTTDIHFIENGIFHLAQIESLIEKPSVIMMIQRLEKLISTDDNSDSSEISSLLEYSHSEDVERNLALLKLEKRSKSSSSGGSYSGKPKH
ncbi:hypothetical protein ACROAK_10745 [Shewanella oncorhynchi]|uniref:hypothetical protein n=1 Tax=Shewanella oncorhynchi TaxID=2726434 RepID=UPI003D79FF08